MKIYGRTSVSEFLGDHVVYRNLIPMDAAIPSLDDLRGALGLAPGITPRKSTPAYAQVIARMLTAARELDAPGTPIGRVIFIGDTRLNDSTAFANICRAGHWPGLAFIGAENEAPARTDIDEIDVGAVMYANRWTALDGFQAYLSQRGFILDASTAVLLDLDKTTLGARGRNDHVIDQARVAAAFATVSDLLGDEFNEGRFKTAYTHLNQTEFHPFTSDNQDYLVYTCLIISAGMWELDELVAGIQAGEVADFSRFIHAVHSRTDRMPPGLHAVHQDVYARVQQGDPTPFKTFRTQEYRATAACLGQLGTGASVKELLSKEIVITHEVQRLARTWQAQGALLFGLSDKPDEASVPTPDLAALGYQPIHRIPTHVVGA